MATTPMFAPDGTLGDIPTAKVQDAVKVGFKLGVDMNAPNGSKGTIPMDKVHDAIKAGFSQLAPDQVPASPAVATFAAPQPVNPSPLREAISNEQQKFANLPGVKQFGEAVAPVGKFMNSQRGREMQMATGMSGGGVVSDAADALPATISALQPQEKPALPETKPGLVKQMIGTKLNPEKANIAPASGQLQPALNNTPQEVVQYAAEKGIDLTPAEASGKPVARTIQAVGERSLLGGDQLAEARQANALKLAQNVRSFADAADPKGMGLTEEGAGESIQQSARVARSVAHENATAAYDQVGIDQADLAGDVSPLKKMVTDITDVRQPHAAVARTEYQAPDVQAALNDIASKPDQLGPNPSIQSMRNLRSEFLERSRADLGQAQTRAQSLYGQAALLVDKQMMKAAEGTPFEDSFRDASEQWAALKQKFDQPGTTLNRILSQRDPATVTRSILNRGSAADIATLQAEKMEPAIDALKRQVIQDVANRGFRVNGDGLAGYSHSFLTQLFGAENTKELYINGELARRMGFQLNPSGTSNVLLGMEQLSAQPSRFMIPMGAARASMPRPAGTYIGISDLAKTP